MDNVGSALNTKFVTFYSYKGGVGRTSALVNSAIVRAREGNRVVILDFDLEAPGVVHYIRKLNDKLPESAKGILEYLYSAVHKQEITSLRESAFDLTNLLDSEKGGSLWVISAGDISSEDYTRKLDSLNWVNIFRDQFGSLILKNLKRQIVAEFDQPDFVFIDSRTGITETGGVCTRHLADDIVMLTSLNSQNLLGTSAIYKQLQGDEKRIILVASNVPSGMPTGEGELFQGRLKKFSECFGREPEIIVYYHPALSLDEFVAPVFSDSNVAAPFATYLASDALNLAYTRLANTIEGENRSSYLFLTYLAGRELINVAFGIQDELLRFEELQGKYPNRLFSSLLQDIHALINNVKSNSSDANLWNSELASKIDRSIRKIKSESLSGNWDSIRDGFFSHLIKVLEVIPMSTWLEPFLTQDRQSAMALLEISRGRYDWPSEYYRNQLENIKGDDVEKTCICNFNLATCYSRLGKRILALETYRTFNKAFQKLPLSKRSIENQCNVLFCAAIAAKESGNLIAAREFIDRSITSAQKVEDRIKIFTPIEYKSISKDVFLAQLNAFLTNF